MNYEQRRALFFSTHSGNNPPHGSGDDAQSDDLSSISGSESCNSTPASPHRKDAPFAPRQDNTTNNGSNSAGLSPTPTLRHDSYQNDSDDASSDASTVKPPDIVLNSPPRSPPPSPLQNSPQRTIQLFKSSRIVPNSPPASLASSAETLSPPPLPANQTTPAQSVVRSIIVRVPDEEKPLDMTLSPHIQTPGKRPYPYLSDDHFRFSENVGELCLYEENTMRIVTLPPGAGVLPPSIANSLSSYQRDGVTFLFRLYERGRGGLLADAMGLGKTVQTVCFLGAAFAIWDRVLCQKGRSTNGFHPRILIVVPASVRDNWKREFETWTPFRVRQYERKFEPEISRAFRDKNLEVLISSDHAVAAHPFFRRPVWNDDSWKWDVVIVDEIHIAKNSSTKIFKAIQSLPKVAAFGLTGTAIQNRLNELYNVLSLVVPPSFLPEPKMFRSFYIDPISKGSKKDVSIRAKQKSTERISRLRNLLSKHMVRRPKSVIDAQLPGKTDYVVMMRMKRNGLQGYMYQRFQNSYDIKLLRDARKPCDCGSGEISRECCHRFPTTEDTLADAPIWRAQHKNGRDCERCPNCICLLVQHYSRFLAAHAALLLPEDDEVDREKAEGRRECFRYYLGKHAHLVDAPLTCFESMDDVSCKLNAALRLIREYEVSGHKTIIFYESLRLGNILQRWAVNKGIEFAVIDGRVNKGERQGVVDRFNKDRVCRVFFISKKAGGTGLNICGADRVLIFEPCWNPTLDLQAGDRAYRLGQTRDVDVIRLVVENTIEHYVFKTAISKSQVSNAILDDVKEEWRIRDSEVGSMQAMLSMGDAYSDSDGQTQMDIFRAEDLIEHKGGPKGQVLKRTDVDFIQQDGGTDAAEEVENILGDALVCSLNVDVDDTEWIPRREPISSRDEGTPEEVEGTKLFNESQMVADLLECEGGDKPMVMTSTSARKRKRQIMGTGTVNGPGGINALGATDLNVDEDLEKMKGELCNASNEENETIKRGRPIKQRSTKRISKLTAPHSTVSQRNTQTHRENPRGAANQHPAETVPSSRVKQRAPTSRTSSKRTDRNESANDNKVAKTKPAVSAFAARARVRR